MTEILGVPRPIYARHTPLSDGNAAPRYAPQLLHVIQREQRDRRIPRMVRTGSDDVFSKSAVILALRCPRLGREPSEADRVRKGGAREREKLSPQGGSGVERTLRRRNPPLRGRAVRCRYHGRTTWGIPARSARMTADFEKALSLPLCNQQGDSSVASLPLNDSK